MRVITGTARGRQLISLPGDDITRPTADKVKEGIFSAIQFDVEGRQVLDLFSGSGQLAIETLSRGAAFATIVDCNQRCIDIINKNLENTGFSGLAKVIRSDYSSFLSTARPVYGIAFIDPPYASGLMEDALRKCAGVMALGGIIVCEHLRSAEVPGDFDDIKFIKTYNYGITAVSIYRKSGMD